MLPRICAGSPKAMQQVDIVQSRMSLHCPRGKCNFILAPSCAHSLLEKKVNTIFFFFQPLVYVHNQMYKCRLLITLSLKTVQARQKVLARIPACADSYQPSLLEKKCSVSFQRPFVSLIICSILVSSADNLFKQLGPRSDPAKLSCENGAHVKSRMSLRCWRGKCFFIFIIF